MTSARDYESWFNAAQRLDQLEGNDAWREADEHPLYDAGLLRRHINEFDTLIAQRDVPTLEATITESLFRNLNDITQPVLYEQTRTGTTKRITQSYLDACERALSFLRDAAIPGLTSEAKGRRFQRAYDNLGQTALTLSGGGAWGLYHLGVVQALRQHDLLPDVICGSSMGAIVASGVGVRTDDELDEMYAHPEQIHRVAVRMLGPVGMLRKRAFMDPDQLDEHVRTNIGEATFAEAYAKTGRALNVTVSPTRNRQKPRVLSYKTAPDVLVSDATVASCAIPGFFAPVALRQRVNGQTIPYVPTERWVDGSMRGDLPLRRLGRLYNVNHFVVSQANPFVVPFVSRHRDDPVTRALRFGGSLLRAQAAAVLDETRKHVHTDRARTMVDMAHALTAQHYGGDIDIHPRVSPAQYTRVMSNPSLEQLRGYILGGEQATWQRLALIRDQTRITRLLASIVASLK